MEPPISSKDSLVQPAVSMTERLITKHLNGKETEWTTLASKKEPLNLLDMPIDVLQSILREVTHTNDLTSLALTHSALHNLVIPHIYSRFDIVWPDANATIESRIGVDALTYGLATLVMAQDVFGEAPYQQSERIKTNKDDQNIKSIDRVQKIRRGNNFAQFTRKFSLGNGPADWVQEYLITKEGGKMLGTLVALAMGRMRNLETFIWDMPTGVLRDVWLALASLADRNDGQECRLEKVWVRWHDNQDQGPLPSPPPPGSTTMTPLSHLPSILTGPANTIFQIPPFPRVEFPTFSILPPLKSLSVLDIDELPYAEEMSILIEKSLEKLQELRIGIAQHAQFDIWARPPEDRTLTPHPLMSQGQQSPRPGGILGIIFSQFCDATPPTIPNNSQSNPPTDTVKGATENDESQDIDGSNRHQDGDDLEGVQAVSNDEMNQLGILLSSSSLQDDISGHPSFSNNSRPQTADENTKIISTSIDQFGDNKRSTNRLHLKVLEIERVYLSINVLSRAIDWTRLISLTLLGCRNHEQLWKALRKRFTPKLRTRTPSSTSRTTSLNLTNFLPHSGDITPKTISNSSEDYSLNIKRIHTDSVSPAFIAFVKDTLAPDSLEWLFLQESSNYKSTVSIDMIYRGAIRRHRGSLKKLLIDSELRSDDETPDLNWRRWIYNRDLLTAITNGKMQLRELSMSIDYKDWHFFLQRLPNATHLRSLHISHISEHVHGRVDSQEAALQVLDIVALRPELELCYLGIQSQCFEVLEYPNLRKSRLIIPLEMTNHIPGEIDEIDDVNELTDDNNDDSDLDLVSSGEDTEDETQSMTKSCFRLREILFYDDKVSIFKARHGRL